MATHERRVEAGFAEWCRQNKVYCLKLAAISVIGFPDRTVLLPGGRVVFIEFKSPTGRTSRPQDRLIAVLRGLGFPVLVTSCKDEAVNFVREYQDEARG